MEIARNSPPIVLLIFLYSLWWKVFPPVGEALNPLPGVFASMRGFVVPAARFEFDSAGAALVFAAMLLGVVAWRAGSLQRFRSGMAWGGAALLLLGLWSADFAFSVDWPVFTGSNFRGGLELTPELSTILIGLTIYHRLHRRDRPRRRPVGRRRAVGCRPLARPVPNPDPAADCDPANAAGDRAAAQQPVHQRRQEFDAGDRRRLSGFPRGDEHDHQQVQPFDRRRLHHPGGLPFPQPDPVERGQLVQPPHRDRGTLKP
ncbi:membrane hypothetical protein [Hyphomicrobiales bacterium]|nr:membrane hypothetical protein [Hyphomicrobiales bacterium]